MAHDREALQQRLRDLFVQELEENLRTITRGLLELETQGPGEVDVGDLFRSAHGLKGAAHAAGVAEAVGICDRMESTFAAVRDGELRPDAAVVSVLLSEVDALTRVAASIRGATTPPPAQTVPRDIAAPDADTGPDGSHMPSGDERAEPGTAPRTGSPRHALPAQTIRVDTEKIEALITASGESLASSERLAVLVANAARTSEAVQAGLQRWRALRASVDAGPAPVDVRTLDDLLEEASARVSSLVQSIDAAERDVGHASAVVAEAAHTLRLQPLADALEGLDRIVHDVAAGGGKKARLSFDIGDVEVDRSVVAAIRDPLLHLVRNAVDHGVERPEERVADGKPPIGTVTVSAELKDNLVTMAVADDGGGVDVDALLAAAERRGVQVPSASLDVAFLPGLSTASTVTAVSGRGVGLDAVRARLEQIGGSIELASEPGTGTTFTLTVPVTLTTMRVLLTDTDDEIVGLPVALLERVATVRASEIREVEGQSVINVDGNARQALSLAAALGLDGAHERDEALPIVLIRGENAAFVVGRLVANTEVVVRPAPRRVEGTAGLLGVAVLANGDAALIVNPAALVRSGAGAVMAHEPSGKPSRRQRALLVEDTVTTRALERSILEAAGYDVITAIDGLQAWDLLQSEEVDVVITDVDMPRMDGFALCEAIRRAPALQHLPVVLVTSLASDRDRQRGADSGADAYFVKSDFEQGTLLDTVQRLL